MCFSNFNLFDEKCSFIGSVVVLYSLWSIYSYSSYVRSLDELLSLWLLFKANSAFFRLFHGENKLILNEMMMSIDDHNTYSFFFLWILYKYVMLGRGICEKYQSRDERYFSQIPLPNMIYLFNYTEYYLEHWLNK